MLEGGKYLLWISFFATSVPTYGIGQSSRPNIVFILSDDQGFNDIGYHAREHGSRVETPFLDELAREGIKLENYYVQPACSPTRSQLMSGRYQIHTGSQHKAIKNNQPRALPLENKILPEQLKNCGYDTHMVGKWHLGSYRSEFLPWNRGFNSFYGFLIGGCDYYTNHRCYDGLCGHSMWSSKTGPDNSTRGEYSANLFSRKSIEAIDNRDPAKPLFLYLSYQSVHAPLQVPRKYEKQFKDIKDSKRRIYAGMVLAMDESIRNVTNHLEKVGILDNTIIIFSSDNGGQMVLGGNNWPLRGRKGTLWEGGIRAVGFAYGKPLDRRGIAHVGLLHVSDWFPTLLGVAKCPMLNHTLPLDGYNQWDAIRQKTVSPRKEILHNIDPLHPRLRKGGVYKSFRTSVRAAIRSGPWKLLTGDPGNSKWVTPPESKNIKLPKISPSKNSHKNKVVQSVKLYHIKTDPYEHHDVSYKFPDVVKNLLRRLAAYNATAVPPIFPRKDPKADPKLNGGYWGPWLD